MGSGAVPLGRCFTGNSPVVLVLVRGESLGVFGVKESAFVEGVGPILEGAAAGVSVEGAFSITSLLVCQFAAKLSEFCANAGVVKSVIFSSVAMPPGIEPTCFFMAISGQDLTQILNPG